MIEMSYDELKMMAREVDDSGCSEQCSDDSESHTQIII